MSSSTASSGRYAATSRQFPPADLHRIRPTQRILRRGAATIIAFLVPITVILYFLTVPDGPWLFILVPELVILAGILAAIFMVRRTGLWVGRKGIAERGFFGRTNFVPVKTIGSIVLVDTFVSGGTERVPQLFICDADGKQIVRMRGQFWSRRSMEFVSKTLGLPVNELLDVVTAAELLEEYPGLLYWFERHPRMFGLLFVAVVIACGAILYGILEAMRLAS
jgi:hypothetical protein